jgi:hypothetical protein
MQEMECASASWIDEFAVQIDEKSFFAKTFTFDHR